MVKAAVACWGAPLQLERPRACPALEGGKHDGGGKCITTWHEALSLCIVLTGY